jgi:hypothetical protein
MPTSQDIEFLKSAINQRKKLIGWNVSKNDLTVGELDKMLEKLDRIVGRGALLMFVIDHYARLRKVPSCKHKRSIVRIDKMYNESFENNNN